MGAYNQAYRNIILMKKAIKNWLLKDELKEIKDIRDDLMNFPTHDQVNDVVESEIESARFITESDMEDQLSDMITECDLYSSLSSNNVVFHDDIEDILNEDQVNEIVSVALDNLELSEVIDEEVSRVFNAKAESIVKKVLKDIPGYFIYEQVKRYVEEDYVKWEHFSLNHDDLTVKVDEIQEIVNQLEAFQAPGIDKVIFFANFKDAIRKLLDETDILPSDE